MKQKSLFFLWPEFLLVIQQLPKILSAFMHGTSKKQRKSCCNMFSLVAKKAASVPPAVLKRFLATFDDPMRGKHLFSHFNCDPPQSAQFNSCIDIIVRVVLVMEEVAFPWTKGKHIKVIKKMTSSSMKHWLLKQPLQQQNELEKQQQQLCQQQQQQQQKQQQQMQTTAAIASSSCTNNSNNRH